MVSARHIKLQQIAKLYFEKKGYEVEIEKHLKELTPKHIIDKRGPKYGVREYQYNLYEEQFREKMGKSQFDLVLKKDGKLYGAEVVLFGNPNLVSLQRDLIKPKVFEDIFLVFPLFPKFTALQCEGWLNAPHWKQFFVENEHRIIRIMDEIF